MVDLPLSSHRLKQVFRQYNQSENGQLSLHEFLDIFIPKEKEHRHFKPVDELMVQKVKDLTDIRELFPAEAISELRNFLSLVIKIDKIIERILEEIMCLSPFGALSDFK